MKRRLGMLVAALVAAAGVARAQSNATVNPARDANAVLYPRSADPSPVAKVAAAPNGSMTVILVCLLGAGGGWMLWNRIRTRGPAALGGRQLTIAETKSLGNRQFLVVASYQDRKFLLGVCPGRIDLLSSLGTAPEAGTAPSAPKFSL
jgi:flagellar protein FliO/FliZ